MTRPLFKVKRFATYMDMDPIIAIEIRNPLRAQAEGGFLLMEARGDSYSEQPLEEKAPAGIRCVNCNLLL